MPTVTNDHPRVAVVTGGSGGIGGETAQRLAASWHGGRGGVRRAKAPAEEVVTAIIEAGGKATSFQADVAEESDVAALFDTAELSYGGVDVVVNAAGVMLLSPLAELDLRDLRPNASASTCVARSSSIEKRPAELRSGGAIINFSSSVVRSPVRTTRLRRNKGSS